MSLPQRFSESVEQLFPAVELTLVQKALLDAPAPLTFDLLDWPLPIRPIDWSYDGQAKVLQFHCLCVACAEARARAAEAASEGADVCHVVQGAVDGD